MSDKIIVLREETEDIAWKAVKIGAAVLVGVAMVGGLGVLLAQDQMARHQRDLFSPQAFKRLAALGHMGREPASVSHIRLLRDFIAWEPRKLLRERAHNILDRMENEVDDARSEPVAAVD